MVYRLLALLICLLSLRAALALAQGDAESIVATAVRQNGYPCEAPQSATPDPAHTTPGEKAWIIDCGNAIYRVKFMGDRGAEVTPIGG